MGLTMPSSEKSQFSSYGLLQKNEKKLVMCSLCWSFGDSLFRQTKSGMEKE